MYPFINIINIYKKKNSNIKEYNEKRFKIL